MDVSVIVCTYNRSKSLARALESLATSKLAAQVDWEVLVVDNNSKDETRLVTDEFCRRYPGRFRYTFEPEQGKSWALNTGVRAASGDILVFTDDDVIVGQEWLDKITAPLRDRQWAGSGGRVLPEPGFDPPSWLAVNGPLNQLGALCAYFEPGEKPGRLEKPPIGANMAFRREMFAKYGSFRVDLGPRPGSEIRHEDTEFGRRIMLGGDNLYYEPSAVVYHEIHESRVRKEFFLAWWSALGQGSIREADSLPAAIEILKMIVRIVRTLPHWAFGVESQRRFYCKCRIWYEAGKLKEIFRQMSRARESMVPQSRV